MYVSRRWSSGKMRSFHKETSWVRCSALSMGLPDEAEVDEVWAMDGPCERPRVVGPCVRW
jgi:hypothetical protein